MSENYNKLFEVLQVLSSVKLDTVIIEPEEDKTTFKGVDEGGNIVLLDSIDERIAEHSLAVRSVRTILSRYNLFFDKDKINYSIIEDDKEGWAKKLVMENSEMNVSYTFSDANALSYPQFRPEDENVATVIFGQQEYQELAKAVSSMKMSKSYEDMVEFRCTKSGDIKLTIRDGAADSYSKIVGQSEDSEPWVHTWKTDSLLTLLKEAVSDDEEVSMEISDKGIAYIKVSMLEFMLSPV